LAHYARFDEATRLSAPGFGLLERLRTEQILDRTLPAPPATIIDVGSGPGVYSVWLSQRGYEVHAIDPVPHHIEQTLARAADHGVSLASATVGDARSLEMGSASVDVALLMGPLYHLQAHADRLLALTEAHRVLGPGGMVAAAAISRFASALDGLDQGFIDDPVFRSMVETTLETGRHSNPTDDPRYFTTAYFHHATELDAELADSGFARIEVHAVEGLVWLAPDLEERLADPHRRIGLLELADRLAREPSLLGASPHLLAVGFAE
jgi:ubiquinone/menaquinone biosynthesis C-methylase UbiE